MVDCFLSVPHEFYCITDKPIEGINCIEADPALQGWWQKIRLFKDETFKEDRVIYFDLDTYIVGSIDHLADYQGDFAMLGDFWHSNRVASGVMLWNPKSCWYLWEAYLGQGKPQAEGWEVGDGWWLQRNCRTADILQVEFPGTFASYKSECTEGIPGDVSVVCFHGEPRPHQSNGWAGEQWRLLNPLAKAA